MQKDMQKYKRSELKEISRSGVDYVGFLHLDLNLKSQHTLGKILVECQRVELLVLDM